MSMTLNTSWSLICELDFYFFSFFLKTSYWSVTFQRSEEITHHTNNRSEHSGSSINCGAELKQFLPWEAAPLEKSIWAEMFSSLPRNCKLMYTCWVKVKANADNLLVLGKLGSRIIVTTPDVKYAVYNNKTERVHHLVENCQIFMRIGLFSQQTLWHVTAGTCFNDGQVMFRGGLMESSSLLM